MLKKGCGMMNLQQYVSPSEPPERMLQERPPFMHVYGSEVVLPVDVVIQTHQMTAFKATLNNQALREVLDLLPLVRLDAYLR